MEPSGLWLASRGVLTAYGRAADVEAAVWFPDYADVEKTVLRFLSCAEAFHRSEFPGLGQR